MVKSLVGPHGPNGHFMKGFSGNPGGRPPAERAVVELARSEGVASLRTLIEIRDNPKASDSTRAYCAQVLLDRGFGKAKEFVNVSSDETDHDRAELVSALFEALHRKGDGPLFIEQDDQ
jgi:hypothetical protein